MEELVLELFKSGKKLDANEIACSLNKREIEDFKDLLKVLEKLETEFKIYRINNKKNKNKYMLFSETNMHYGKLIVNKRGFGFIDRQGSPSIYIDEVDMNGALNGDLVIVELKDSAEYDKKQEGKIVRIVKRNLGNIVGEFRENKKGNGYLFLDDERLKMKIDIEKGKTKGAVYGHKVVVKLTRQIDKHKYLGEVKEILGHKNDPGVDILSIVYKYGINTVFPGEVMDEVDLVPDRVLETEYEGRRDLRDKMIFTIDGDDTKDIDDAINVEVLENGNYKLGVYIADVSYYVKEDSALDLEALDRGTSVYLVDRVVPMLPHKLSNGICSLNPNVDRLSMACEMEINENGKVVDYEIFPAIINSKIQMTYKKVNDYLEKNVVHDGYEPFTKTLSNMKVLADILRKYKETRGYIDFDIDEMKILVDESCKPIEITLRERGTGEKLIEDFMIAANETVGSHMYHLEVPSIYRVHDKPDPKKIATFISYVESLGLKTIGVKKEYYPADIKEMIDKLRCNPLCKVLAPLLLRCMCKAIYDTNNIGHFGIASKIYSHFTSPIRRYPDLILHRLIRNFYFQGNMDNSTINHFREKLAFASVNSSEKERNSVDCEREVEDMKAAEYMEGHIGEEFDGTISSVMNFGMFVELDNLIEGLISTTSLKDDYYLFNEDTMSLVGERSGKKYRLGDKVRVKVVSASKSEKTIDFSLVVKGVKKDGKEPN